MNAWAPGEALLRAAFTAAVRSTAGSHPEAPGTTNFEFAPERVFRTVQAVALWLGATVQAVNEQARWMVLRNPLRDSFLPHQMLIVSVVGRDDGCLVDIRPRGVEGLAFTICAMALISETSRLLVPVATCR